MKQALKAGLNSFKNPFIIGLICVFICGLTLPLPANAEGALSVVSTGFVALLFFLYGARLPREQIVGGLKNWRLQLGIALSTFVAFPFLGAITYHFSLGFLPQNLALGVFFVTLLPSTVQSSVTFTSIAKGNIAGAICAASLSNLAGTLLTPLLVYVCMAQNLQITLDQTGKIFLNILLPFFVGQTLENRLGPWLRAHKHLTCLTDNATVLLVVAHAVVLSRTLGLWQALNMRSLLLLLAVSAVILAVMLTLTWNAGKALKLGREDKIALLMCGSKKSLTTGLPIASILFPPALTASITIPVIVFHQLQLFTCSCLAQIFAETAPDVSSGFASARNGIEKAAPDGK